MRKILTLPLRLSVGWGLSPRLLGFLGAAMLVLLRLTIGAHFYTEGLDKYRTGTWDATPFFANARGPMAEDFRGLVWDHDASLRRNMEEVKLLLATHREAVTSHYELDKAQQNQAQANYADAVADHQLVLDDNEQDLHEYDLGVKRIADMKSDPARSGGGLAEQIATVDRENKALLRPVLAQIDQVWKNYEAAQNSVATTEQIERHGTIYLSKPRRSMMDTNIINSIVPYFDMGIGICLLFGLFTPVAGLAAAGFLGSVFLSQYPPVTGPNSSFYQLVECMACLVLAATAAGRFAGLDYFLHMIVRKVYGVSGEDE